MHTTSSQNLLCINLQVLNAWPIFLLHPAKWIITISSNCHVRIYKSHMHKHFYFCSVTISWYKCCLQTYWSCIHKCIGAYSKILVNWKKYIQIKKTNFGTWFIVTHINICVKWLLIVSHLPWTQTEKAYSNKQNRNCCTYRILKTVYSCCACRHWITLTAHTCKLNLKDNTSLKFF